MYFDNVGGEHLEAAISAMADFGRVAACGAIATYNDTDPSPGPRNMFLVVTKRISIRGFIVLDHGDVAGEFYRTAGAWHADGKLAHRETVVDGLDARRGRVPRPPPRGQHRQDAGPALTPGPIPSWWGIDVGRRTGRLTSDSTSDGGPPMRESSPGSGVCLLPKR